ncbi:hypothetical protein MMC30_000815, partial [Trapelia coarctata]|nr:hypothetical protein [Trapelia coarctata]
MWSRVLGLSTEKQEDFSSASKKRKDDTQTQRNRTESTVTSTSARKPSQSDERDRGFNPTSTSYSSTSRSPYPGAASASVASSYATAPSNTANASIAPPDLVRNPSLANQMPKAKSGRDERDRGGDRDGKSGRRRDRSSSRDRKVERQDRSRSRDREERKKERREKRERKRDSERGAERGLEKSEIEYKGTTWAGDGPVGSGSFSNQIGAATFTQFPGQYDGGMVGPSNGPPNPPVISDHVPDQFPGQFPTGATAPYRPPLSVNQGGPGLAADYYGDTGESVAQQPGVRPQAPSLIVGAEPHLMAASAIEAPPIEPSATGGVGAAASFFSGASFQSPSATPMPGQQSARPTGPPPQSSSSGQPGSYAAPVALAGSAAIGYMASNHGNTSTAPPPPNSTFPPTGGVPTPYTLPPTLPPGAVPSGNNYHSASAPIIPTLGSAAVGAAAGYMVGGHTSQQHQPNLPPANGGTSGYRPPTSQQSSSQYEISHDSYSGSTRPPKPGKSSPPSNIPLYAAGAVGAAGLAAAAYHHNYPSQSQNQSQNHSHGQGQSQSQHQASYTGRPHTSTTMVHQHRHHGPLDKFVDFFRDPEGVARFEEYTEYIGVCRYCFEPGSSPRDAPRKHHYRKRRSNERLGASMRVDKESRYGVPDGESRRKKNDSWLATGLTGYGLAKVGKTLFAGDSDDDHSARIGHANYSTTSLHGRRYSNSPSRRSSTSYGVTRKSSDAKLRRRSRSRSRDRKSGLTQAAVGAAIGASVVAASSQSKQKEHRSQHSPKEETGIFGGFFSSPPEPERHRSSHKKSKKKKNSGFFNFGNSSSSSSDSGLVAGTGSDRSRRKKSAKPRIKDHNDANAALIGLGAAAAALAAAEGRKGDKGKRRADVVAVKEVRYKDNRKQDREKEKRNQSAPAHEETIWVDASEDEGYPSVDSMLAYGLSRRRSQESLSSDSSGTNKWGWRWRSKPEKKKKKDTARTENKIELGLGAAAGLAGIAAGAAILSHGDRRDPAVGSLPPLQHVHPISTSDPSHYDVTRHDSITSTNQPYQTSRPAAIPLQQPQPVAPISSVVYTSQAPYVHAYSAPAGPPILSQQPQPFSYATGYVFPPQAHAQTTTPRDVAPVQELRRRDTSPTPKVVHIEPRTPKRASTDLSSARFNVVGKHDDTKRKEERQERTKSASAAREKDRKDTREEVEAIDRQPKSKKKSSDKRDEKVRREEEIDRELERLRKEEADVKKKNRDSWAAPALAGVAGTVVGAVTAGETSKSDDRRERREEKEAQRAAQLRDQQLEEAKQRKSDEKQAAIAKKAAALIKRTPSPTTHESYVDFFVPAELQSKSKDVAPKDDSNGGNDITTYSVPEKNTVEPSERGYPSAHAYTFEGGESDPKHMNLPWQVPRLELTQPTPPASMAGSVRGDASPIMRPEGIHSSDDEQSASVSTREPTKKPAQEPAKVKVTFGESETREYEVITPEDHRDEFIDSSHGSLKDRAEKAQVVETKLTMIESPVEEIKRDRIPGQFEDDIDFAATLAAGVEASGFDPAIVIDNPTYHRRESPLGSDNTGFYRTPYFETVTDLGLDTPGTQVEPPVRGFVEGEVPPTAKEEVKGATKDEVMSAVKYEATSTPKYEITPTSKDEVKPYVARPLTDEEAVRTGRRPEKKKAKTEKAQANDPFFVPLSSMSRNPPKIPESTESSHPYSQEPEVIEATPRSIPRKSDDFKFDFGKQPTETRPTSQLRAKPDESYAASESPKDISKDPKTVVFQKLATDIPLPGNDDDEWTPTPRSETKSEGRRSNGDGDEYDSVEDVASTAMTAPLPDDGDEPRKHKRKSKRKSSGYYDDNASAVSAPAKYDDSRETTGKGKKEKKGGLFGLFSKSTEPAPEKEGTRDDFEEPKRKGSKKSKDRKSKRDSGDFYSQPSESVADLSRAADEGTNGHSRKSSKDKGERSSRDKDERRKSRKSSKTDGDSGRATQELPAKNLNTPDEELDLISEYENDPGEGTSRSREQEEPLSFLGVRREETEPPDLAGLPDPGGSNSRRMSVETAFRDSLSSKIIEESLPPLPPSRPTTPTAVGSLRDLPPLPGSVPASPAVTPAGQRRRVSMLQLSESGHAMASSSPTAISLMFRRFPTSSGVSRSSPSTPGQSPQGPTKLSPRNRQSRPLSTEFKSSKEFRPLWLVERHATDPSRRKETPEEVYPSLPSSHSNSRASSVHDPAQDDANELLERWTMDEDATLSHEPPQFDERELEYRPDLLDSQQATPTKDSFHLEQANEETRRLQRPSFPGEAPFTQPFDFEEPQFKYGWEDPRELPPLPNSSASSTYDEQSSHGTSSTVMDAAAGALAAAAAITAASKLQTDQDREQQAQTTALPEPTVVAEREGKVEKREADIVEPSTEIEIDPLAAVKASKEEDRIERIGSGDTLRDEATLSPSIAASQPAPLVEDKKANEPLPVEEERIDGSDVSGDVATQLPSLVAPKPNLPVVDKEDTVMDKPDPVEEESVQATHEEWSASTIKKSKRDKKGKGKSGGLETTETSEMPQEETPALPDISREIPEEQEPVEVPEDYFEGPASFKKGTKAKKGKGKSGSTATFEAPSTSSAIQDADSSQATIEDWSTPSKSKKGKKGKTGKLDSQEVEALSTPESSREVTDEAVPAVDEWIAPSTLKKGKKGKKGKHKGQSSEGPEIPDVPRVLPEELLILPQGRDEASSKDIDQGADKAHAELLDEAPEQADSKLLSKDLSDRTFFGTAVAAAAAVGAAVANSTSKKDKKRKGKKKGAAFEEEPAGEPTESQVAREAEAEQDNLPIGAIPAIEEFAERSIGESNPTQDPAVPAEEQELSTFLSAPDVSSMQHMTGLQEDQAQLQQPLEHDIEQAIPADIRLPLDADLDLLPSLPASPILEPQIAREVDEAPPSEHYTPSILHERLTETDVPTQPPKETTLQETQFTERGLEEVPRTVEEESGLEDISAALSEALPSEQYAPPTLQEHLVETDVPVQPAEETTLQEAQPATTGLDVVPEPSADEASIAKDHSAALSEAPPSERDTPSISHEHPAEIDVLNYPAKETTLQMAQAGALGLGDVRKTFVEEQSVAVKDPGAVVSDPSVQGAEGEVASASKLREVDDDAVYTMKKGKKGKKNRKSRSVTPLVESLPEEPEATRQLTEALEAGQGSLSESSAQEPTKGAEEEFAFTEQPSSKKKGKKGKKQKIAFDDWVTEGPQPDSAESSQALPTETVAKQSQEFELSEIITPRDDGSSFPVMEREKAVDGSSIPESGSTFETTPATGSTAEEVGYVLGHPDKGPIEEPVVLEQAIIPVAERSLPTGDAIEEPDELYSMPKSKKDKKKRKNLSRSDSSYLNAAATMEPPSKNARTLEPLPEKIWPPSAEEVLLSEASNAALPEDDDNDLVVDKARDMELSEDRGVDVPETQTSMAALPSEGSEILAEYRKPTMISLPITTAESSDAIILGEASGKSLPADDDSDLFEDNRNIAPSATDFEDHRDQIPSVHIAKDLPSSQQPLPNIFDEALYTPLPQDDWDDYFKPQESERELEPAPFVSRSDAPSLTEVSWQEPDVVQRVGPSLDSLAGQSTSTQDQVKPEQEQEQQQYIPQFDPIFDDAMQTPLPDEQDDYFEATRDSPEPDDEFISALNPSEDPVVPLSKDEHKESEITDELHSIPHVEDIAAMVPVDTQPLSKEAATPHEETQDDHFESTKGFKGHEEVSVPIFIPSEAPAAPLSGDNHIDLQMIDTPHPAPYIEDVAVTVPADTELMSERPIAPAEDAKLDRDPEETAGFENDSSKKKRKKDKKKGKSKALDWGEEIPAESSQEQSVSELVDDAGVGAKPLAVMGAVVAGSAVAGLLGSKKSKKDNKKGKSKALDWEEEPASESAQEQSTTEPVELAEASREDTQPATAKEPPAAADDDTGFLSSKKNKKGKKEGQSSTLNWDEGPALGAAEGQLEAEPTTWLVDRELETLPPVVEPIAEAVDSGFVSSKKSKKDKRKGKSKATDWEEEIPAQDPQAAMEPEATRSIGKSSDVPTPASVLDATAPVADDSEFSISKKSKKDKKKKRPSAADWDEEPSMQEAQPTPKAEPTRSIDESSDKAEPTLTVGEAAPGVDDTDFLTSKKSKRDKKKGKKGQAYDWTEGSTGRTTPAILETLPLATGTEEVRDLDADALATKAVATEPEPEATEFFTLKKSKKDKKKAKKGASVAWDEEAEQAPTPEAMESTDKDRAMFVPEENLTEVPFEQPTVKAAPEEAEPDLPTPAPYGELKPEGTEYFSLNRSRKDKLMARDEEGEAATTPQEIASTDKVELPFEQLAVERTPQDVSAETSTYLDNKPVSQEAIPEPVPRAKDFNHPRPESIGNLEPALKSEATRSVEPAQEVPSTADELSRDTSASGYEQEIGDNNDFGGFVVKKKKGKKAQKAESTSRTPDVETPAEEPIVAGGMESSRDFEEPSESTKANTVPEVQDTPAAHGDFLDFGTIKRKKSKKSKKQAPVIWEDETATPALVEVPTYADEVIARPSSQSLETLYEGEPFVPQEPSYHEPILASDPELTPGIDRQISYDATNRTLEQDEYTIPSLEDILREEDAEDKQEHDPEAYEEIRKQAFERELEATPRDENTAEDRLLSPDSAQDQNLHVVTDQLSVEQAEESLGIARRRSWIGKHRKGDHSPAGRHSSASSSTRSLGLLPGDVEHSPHSPSPPRPLGIPLGDVERASSPHPEALAHGLSAAEEASLYQSIQDREAPIDDDHLLAQRGSADKPREHEIAYGQDHEESREPPRSSRAMQSQESDPRHDMEQEKPVNVSEGKQLKNTGRAAAIVPSVGAGVALFENLARKSSVAEKDKDKKKGGVRRSDLEELKRGEASSELIAHDQPAVEVHKASDDHVPSLVSQDEYRPSARSPRVSSLQEDSDINRDSAVHISESPLPGDLARFQHSIRDSGYQGTEASPTFRDSLDQAGSHREHRTSGESFANIRDPQVTSLRDSGTTFDSSTSVADSSENPLNISIEVDPAYNVSISRPEAYGHQMVVSDVRDRDSGEQLPVHYQERHARDSVSPDRSHAESQPSPVDSSTKPRSSELFQSSPSTREDLTRSLPQQQNSPSYGATGHQDYSASMDDLSTPTKKPIHQELPRSRDIETTQGPTSSLFGGPVGINSDIQSIISPPGTPLSSSRRQLNTINEHSPEETTLQKRISGSSDMSLSEHGLRTRRRSGTAQNVSQQRVRSPLAAASEDRDRRISIDELDSRLSWPAVDEDTHSVDLERSKSRNTDAGRRSSSRHSQSPLPPLATDMIRQHEADYR